MSFVVSRIWGVYEQNSIMNSVRVDDWTAEWEIIARNELDLRNIFLNDTICVIQDSEAFLFEILEYYRQICQKGTPVFPNLAPHILLHEKEGHT